MAGGPLTTGLPVPAARVDSARSTTTVKVVPATDGARAPVAQTARAPQGPGGAARVRRAHARQVRGRRTRDPGGRVPVAHGPVVRDVGTNDRTVLASVPTVMPRKAPVAVAATPTGRAPMIAALAGGTQDVPTIAPAVCARAHRARARLERGDPRRADLGQGQAGDARTRTAVAGATRRVRAPADHVPDQAARAAVVVGVLALLEVAGLSVGRAAGGRNRPQIVGR